MNGEKQARAAGIFDRLSVGIFMLLLAQLVGGALRARPLDALGPALGLLALAAVAYAVRLVCPPWRPRRTNPLRLHLPVLALIFLPGCLFSIDPARSLFVALAVGILFLAHFAFLDAFLARERGVLSPEGFSALVAGGAVLSVFGRVAGQAARAAAAYQPWYNLAPADGLPMAPFDHLYALLLVGAFPVVAAPALAPGSVRGRGLRLAAGVVIAVGIVFSFSRAAWIALGVELLLLAAFGLPRRRFLRAGILLLAAAGAAVLLPGVGRRALSIFSMSHVTNVQRIEQWAVALDLIGRAPFSGHGWGVFGDLFQAATGGHGVVYWCPHNLYLHIAVSSGIPALCVFLAWILDFLLQAPAIRRAALSGAGSWQAKVRWGGIVAVCGVLCYGLFDL